MKRLHLIIFLLLMVSVTACLFRKKEAGANMPPAVELVRSWLADEKATKETAALFYNLKKSAQKQVLFGHMEDTKNGTDGWNNAPDRSDVKDVTGNYPEVYGFDFGPVTTFNPGKYNEREVQTIHDRAVEAYQRNGVVTFSWHYGNPVSKGSFYWKNSPVAAVGRILPGGDCNPAFKESLRKIAAFSASLKYKRKLVPVIFRPFHEFDGDWFWWGRTHCSTEDYIKLYRYTVTYLRDTLHTHNLLYAFSPDCNFKTTEQYMRNYPGNDYVDVLGMDDYNDLKTGRSPEIARNKLRILADMAREHNKVAAFTETGLENLPQADWYTQMLLKVLKADQMPVAYVMVWSNRPKSYWTPYKGHPAEADFKAFSNDPFIRFGGFDKSFYKMGMEAP